MDGTTIATDRRPIGFWLKLVDRLIDESFDTLLMEAGLTRRHWQVLNVLLGEPATVRQIDTRLAPFLGIDEPTTRPVVDDLCARGWAVVANGGRAALTAAGAAAQAELLEKVSDHRQRITEGMTTGEYAATVAVLRRMAVNLGWDGAAGSA
ncbi:MAG TPA: MarR family transcriptional regulator [Actinomycetes bacterium]